MRLWVFNALDVENALSHWAQACGRSPVNSRMAKIPFGFGSINNSILIKNIRLVCDYINIVWLVSTVFDIFPKFRNI